MDSLMNLVSSPSPLPIPAFSVGLGDTIHKSNNADPRSPIGTTPQGKQALNQYQEGQNKNQSGDQTAGVTGGAHLNRPAGGQGQDLDGDGIPDLQQAAHHADAESGSHGDSSLFASAISRIKGSNYQSPIDEEAATNAHKQAYEKGSPAGMDASSMGMAAALQAFKQFQGGNAGSGTAGAQSSGGSGGQSQLIGLAMAQASKLFDQSGGAASGNKEDAVSGAGSMVMKLLIQSKMQSAGIGGGNSGGMSGLMGMASKFL